MWGSIPLLFLRQHFWGNETQAALKGGCMGLGAQAMGIQRFVFFSIHNAERHPEVPLMLIKACTEQFLRDSGLDFTIFRLCGFMQVGGALAASSAPLTPAEPAVHFREIMHANRKGAGLRMSPCANLRVLTGSTWCAGHHRELRRAHPGGEAGLGHIRRDQDRLSGLPGAACPAASAWLAGVRGFRRPLGLQGTKGTVASG